MKKIMGLIFILIVMVGYLLRFHEYTVWPREGATFDEYAWTWLGMNIIQEKIPISWSPHPQYKIRTHYVSPKGTAYWLVRPYLEHPPVFGLIAGSFALFSGARDMYSVTIAHIRGLALFLGVLSIVFVFLFTKEIYGSRVALFAMLLYATVPTVVIGSRLVQNENFFIPVFLCILYCVIKFLKTKARTFFYIAAVLAGILTLAKVPWWSATLSVSFILYYHKRYADTLRFLSIVAGFFSLFFIWGWYWDFDVFKNLWKLQLHRYDITFDGIYGLFIHPLLVDRFYLDGWIYFGWIAFFGLLSNIKKHAYIVFGLLGYFAIYILGIPNEPGHGWYRYPFYPFLIISFSYLFSEAFKKQSLYVFFSLSFIGLSLLQLTWNPIFGFSYGFYRFFILFAGLTGISTFFRGTWGRRVSFVSSILMTGMLIVLNIWASWIYNEQ